MINLKGEMCVGGSWEMPCFYGRGQSKAEILKKQDETNAVSFDMNYRAVWTGASDGALVSMARLLTCRTLTDAELEGDNQSEYVFSVDVARSDNDNNNQTSIAILKIKRKKTGRVSEVQMPNMITFSGTLNFSAQSVEIKRLAKIYNPVAIVVDDNGLGKGTVDELLKEQIDPLTGENLGCYDTINSERVPEVQGSPKLIFCYNATKYDNKSIPNFISYVETNKLRLLEKKDVNTYNARENDLRSNLMPFIQTDFFVEEVSNLKLKPLNNGGVTIERVTRKLNKDRFSAVQYGLWYIAEFLDNVIEKPSDDLAVLSQYIMW